LQAHRGTPFSTPPEEKQTKKQKQPPPAATDKVVWCAREDRRFWVHRGFDVGGLKNMANMWAWPPSLHPAEKYWSNISGAYLGSDPDALRWCGRSQERWVRDWMENFGVSFINVDPAPRVFLPTWWLDWHYGGDEIAAATATLLLAVPPADWRDFLFRILIRGFHPDRGSKNMRSGDAMLLRLNRLLDDIKAQDRKNVDQGREKQAGRR
jgi:hypothetical protein